MESSPPYPLYNRPIQSMVAFTPIRNIFQNTWIKVKNHLWQLFLLNTVFILVAIAGFILLSIILYSIDNLIINTLGLNSTGYIGIITLILMLVMAIFGLSAFKASQRAKILLLSEIVISDTGIIQLYRMSFKKIFPMILLELMMTLLIIGGLMVFVIPGILFIVILSLAPYFLIVDDLSPINSMRRSISVVTKNFKAIFVRLMILFAINLVFWSVLMYTAIISNLSWWALLTIALTFNLLFSWFSFSYLALIYQDAKKITQEGSARLVWMTLISIVGWIILIIVGIPLMIASLLILDQYSKNLPNKIITIPSNNYRSVILPTIAIPATSTNPISTSSASPKQKITPQSKTTGSSNSATISPTDSKKE